MDVSLKTNPGRQAAYIKTRTCAEQAAKKEPAPAVRAQDAVEISPAGRDALRETGEAGSAGGESAVEVPSFPVFAEAFAAVAKGHQEAVRAYYAKAHEENQSFCDPKKHVWDKYKNPDSPCFRHDLSEDERAWSYDQEMDLLNGGKHLQLNNPYAWPEEEVPGLASAAMEANQLCRTQIDEAVRELFAGKGIALPEDAAFRLTVDPEDHTIHAAGLEDEALAAAIEEALNSGDNGKNLYAHLKLTCPGGDPPGIDYAEGHLAALEPPDGLNKETLAEVQRQAGPLWTRYAETYNPHQKSMSDHILSLDPGAENSQEQLDRVSAAIRVGALDAIARFRAQKPEMSLIPQKTGESVQQDDSVNPYGPLPENAEELVRTYYAEAHQENSALSLPDALQHILEKYKRPGSECFCAGLPEAQRDMAYRQERALLLGSRLVLWDPYALASAGWLGG